MPSAFIKALHKTYHNMLLNFILIFISKIKKVATLFFKLDTTINWLSVN